MPEIERQGGWASLDVPAQDVMDLYEHHGTHDAYHCLRLLGQLGLTGEIAPIRHPAKRRRLKTVLQAIMYRAAKFVAHAHRRVLDFARGVASPVQGFVALQNRLLKAASP